MLCRNGLHEIDPDDSWRGTNRERCRSCQRAAWSRRAKRKVLLGNKEKQNRAYRARHVKNARASHSAFEQRAREDPAYRQMTNDTRRLGISRAEWRRQVAQGIIQLKGA